MNSSRRSRRQARRPLDHHDGTLNNKIFLSLPAKQSREHLVLSVCHFLQAAVLSWERWCWPLIVKTTFGDNNWLSQLGGNTKTLIVARKQGDRMLEWNVAQSFPKIAQNVTTETLPILRVIFLKIAQKVDWYFGYFWNKICPKDLSKIAQSGHTNWMGKKLDKKQFGDAKKQQFGDECVLETF